MTEQLNINLLIQKYNELNDAIQAKKTEMRKQYAEQDKKRLKARKFIIEEMIKQKKSSGEVDDCVYYLTKKERKDPIDEEQLETCILAALACDKDTTPEKQMKKILKDINKNRKVKHNVQLFIKCKK